MPTGIPPRPPAAPSDSTAISVHLRRLLNYADATAALFHRFHSATFFLSSMDDYEQWQTAVFRQYEPLSAVANVMFVPNNLNSVLARINELYQHASAALIRAGQPNRQPVLEQVTQWLVSMWDISQSFPAPDHDRFHLFHGENPGAVPGQVQERRAQQARVKCAP